MDSVSKPYIEQLIYRERKTYHEISELLQRQYPNERGFSERSVRRYCKENGLFKQSGIEGATLDAMVKDVVSKVT
jgi:hypothetical protein